MRPRSLDRSRRTTRHPYCPRNTSSSLPLRSRMPFAPSRARERSGTSTKRSCSGMTWPTSAMETTSAETGCCGAISRRSTASARSSSCSTTTPCRSPPSRSPPSSARMAPITRSSRQSSPAGHTARAPTTVWKPTPWSCSTPAATSSLPIRHISPRSSTQPSLPRRSPWRARQRHTVESTSGAPTSTSRSPGIPFGSTSVRTRHSTGPPGQQTGADATPRRFIPTKTTIPASTLTTCSPG